MSNWVCMVLNAVVVDMNINSQNRNNNTDMYTKILNNYNSS